MNKIAKTVVLAVFLLVMFIDIFFSTAADIIPGKNPEDCKVSYSICRIKGSQNKFGGNIIFVAPRGWKIPKAPEIVVLNPSLKFKLKNGNARKSSDSEYSIPFQLEIEKVKGKRTIKTTDLKIKISANIALCSDICTIISKEITIDCSAVAEINETSDNVFKTIWVMMLLAFLGGFVLNLMPCVLPVILMKIRFFFTSPEGKHSAIFGTICGNYTTFIAFAAFLISLKTAGKQIGWGMHFQNPYFLKSVAVILFLLCLYSFEILQIPFFLHIRSVKKQIFWENFTSSIVAAIIAIPCTAPLLGTAAAFAIQGSCWDIVAIFFCISTGFSVPYLVALLGGITKVQKLPATEKLHKYGKFAKIVANSGAGVTLSWILFLLEAHIGFIGTAVLLVIFATSTTLLVKKYVKTALTCLALVFFVENFPKNTELVGVNGGEWEKSPDILIKEILNGVNPVAQKRVVVINISADWCLTCKYNKINIFNDKEIQQLMKKKDVLYVEGDMTYKNENLMQIIREHGKAGIPFTIILGPQNVKGTVLSEMPSVEEVKKVILESHTSI